MSKHQLQDSELLSHAHRAYDAGDYGAAVKLYKKVLRTNAKYDDLQHRVGICYGRLGQSDLAYRHLKHAVDLKPTLQRYCDFSTAAQHLGRFKEAHALCDKALRLGSDDPAALCAKASLHNVEGDAEAARTLLEPALQRGVLTPQIANAFATTCRNLKTPDLALPVIDRCLESGRLTDADRALLLFRRAEILERGGRYDEAFPAYDEANEIRRRKISFDPIRNATTIDQIIAAWTPNAFAAAPRSRAQNDRPVFIVGMPRSGTSLLEQILATHPAIHGVGESDGILKAADRFTRKAGKRGSPTDFIPILSSRDLDAAAREYLRTVTAGAGSARRVTDKMMINYLFVGLIALLFPRSRVIHCVRDPLDTCLSCYFQDFIGALPFTWDLEHVGAYHRDYRRLMRHWQDVVDVPLHEVAYEDLVENPETVIKDAVEFLGVEWDETCLRFHESDRVTLTASNDQVRQPLFKTSVRRHERFEAFLEPLRRGLEGARG